jgi:hypothetical protein
MDNRKSYCREGESEPHLALGAAFLFCIVFWVIVLLGTYVFVVKGGSIVDLF